jgi:hypothetical protein
MGMGVGLSGYRVIVQPALVKSCDSSPHREVSVELNPVFDFQQAGTISCARVDETRSVWQFPGLLTGDRRSSTKDVPGGRLLEGKRARGIVTNHIEEPGPRAEESTFGDGLRLASSRISLPRWRAIVSENLENKVHGAIRVYGFDIP